MIATLLLIVVGIVAFFVYRHLARNRRRKLLLARPLRPEWKAILAEHVPLYARLPGELQSQLDGLVNLFLAEKQFIGCGGQEITDEVRVTIAGQACILLLNRPTKYFPRLSTIFVYPTAYLAKAPTPDGSLDGPPRQGESWQDGPIVLAWNCVTGGAHNITDGQNVVFHEFAHQLDQEDGRADGAPILESRSCYATWAKILGAEYAGLQQKTRKRRRSVLHQYGATAPAEFFAVATESFLEKPKQLQAKHPELYEELKSYYRIDPVTWPSPARRIEAAT